MGFRKIGLCKLEMVVLTPFACFGIPDFFTDNFETLVGVNDITSAMSARQYAQKPTTKQLFTFAYWMLHQHYCI